MRAEFGPGGAVAASGALDAGAEVLRPLHDAPWGERDAQITDPFGHRWGLSQQLREVSMQEMTQAAIEMFGG